MKSVEFSFTWEREVDVMHGDQEGVYHQDCTVYAVLHPTWIEIKDVVDRDGESIQDCPSCMSVIDLQRAKRTAKENLPEGCELLDLADMPVLWHPEEFQELFNIAGVAKITKHEPDKSEADGEYIDMELEAEDDRFRFRMINIEHDYIYEDEQEEAQ